MNEPLEAKDLPEILADAAASYWVKAALRSALSRDPVDATHGSDMQARLLYRKCRKFSPKVNNIPAISLSAL
jgi:hypothetical protein